jgi:hypothetical protein
LQTSASGTASLRPTTPGKDKGLGRGNPPQAFTACDPPTAAAQDRIHSLAQSTGRTSGEIAQIIKANIDKMGEDFLKAAKGTSLLEVVENHGLLYCLVGDSLRILNIR